MKEDFIESSNYSLSENEEISDIANINFSLETFEKVLKVASDDMNDIKILEASKICESMLQLFLKNEGYLFKNDAPFSYMIEISTNKELIPQECATFLQIIKEYRNNSAHNINTSDKLASTFLNAFMYFIRWFNSNYHSRYSAKKQFKIESCCFIIITTCISQDSKNENKAEEMPIRGHRNQGQQSPQNEIDAKDRKTSCPECGSTELIGDYERAEVICARCGLVIDENLVDMGPEWRAFDHEQRDKRTRVGAPITYTIHDKGLSTQIDWRNKDIYGRDIPERNRAQWYGLRKWQRKIRISGATERNLAFALSELDRDSSRLGLPRSVREEASLVYRSAVENKLIRGRRIESIVAASLYVACRLCNMPRTLDEIAEVSKVTKKEVGRTYRLLTRGLNIKLPPTSPTDYVPRFASELGLSVEAESKAIEIIEKATKKGLTSGKRPTDIAAAALYIASILLGERKTPRYIADIAGVSEVTVRNRCKELTEHLGINWDLEKNSFEYNSGEMMAQKVIDATDGNIDCLHDGICYQLADTPLINDYKQDLILKELREQNEELKKILELVLETNYTVKNIDAKINNITQNLNRIQSQTEKLIRNSWTEEEIDRIIQAHTNECIEQILEYKPDIVEDNQYEKEKIKLLDSFGQETWNKLSEESQTFLITSKFMYNQLLGLNEIIDYSGICVLITKALEVEIFKRFFTNFIVYLDENYQKDYSKYHTALLFHNSEPLHPERFTMGNIAFVLCFKENRFDDKQQKENNKSKLIEYCKSSIFSRYSEEKIEELLASYASSIENIRINYRNPAAHRNQIKRIDAKECFDLVIDVEKLLKKMLDSFDN